MSEEEISNEGAQYDSDEDVAIEEHYSQHQAVVQHTIEDEDWQFFGSGEHFEHKRFPKPSLRLVCYQIRILAGRTWDWSGLFSGCFCSWSGSVHLQLRNITLNTRATFVEESTPPWGLRLPLIRRTKSRREGSSIEASWFGSLWRRSRRDRRPTRTTCASFWMISNVVFAMLSISLVDLSLIEQLLTDRLQKRARMCWVYLIKYFLIVRSCYFVCLQWEQRELSAKQTEQTRDEQNTRATRSQVKSNYPMTEFESQAATIALTRINSLFNHIAREKKLVLWFLWWSSVRNTLSNVLMLCDVRRLALNGFALSVVQGLSMKIYLSIIVAFYVGAHSAWFSIILTSFHNGSAQCSD